MKLRVLVATICVGIFFLTSVNAAERGQCEKEDSYVSNCTTSPEEEMPEITARAMVLMEASTGRILYERNAEKRMYPASTTKIMTLILALEHGNLDDEVEISKAATKQEGSTLWLETGERVPLRDLLYGMMMVSGNDGAVAIAEHIAGSVPAFAEMMTQKAAEIGATHTRFRNANGLPDEQHYTTAHDMAIITAYGYRNPEFEKIVSTKEKSFAWVKDEKHFLRNENQMLWLFEGANGVKTGYTDLAGRCLVTGAKRDGIQLISVVFDSLYMWNDSLALLKTGFKGLQSEVFMKRGAEAGSVAVRNGRRRTLPLYAESDLVAAMKDGDEGHFNSLAELPRTVEAPVQKGDVIGREVLLFDGKEVASVPLLARESIEEKSFFRFLYQKMEHLWEFVFWKSSPPVKKENF